MALPYDVDATWANAPDNTSEPVYDAADLRRADASVLAGAGTAPLGVRGGIAAHSADSLKVTVDGSDVVTVQPGAVVIPGDAVAGTGVYRSALPVAVTGTLTARNATNPRIDLVVFRMLDVDVVSTHTARKGRVEVIAGVPSATPGVPAKPSMSVELARVTVPASGGAAASVNLGARTFAAALGGELLVTSYTTLPTAAAPWQRARALDTGVGYLWNGTAWKDTTPRSDSIVTPTDANGDLNLPFTPAFPPGTVPRVIPALGDDIGATVRVLHAFVTNTEARVRIRDFAGNPLTGTSVRVDFDAYSN